MKQVFGLVGYACNGKSTIIREILYNQEYKFIDLPQIYKKEAYKNGYEGVTQYYTGVGLKEFRSNSREALFNYIDNYLPRDENLIIDDIFDIEVYNKLKDIFPHIKLISFHSKYRDRLARLSLRTGINNQEELVKGLIARDNMKRYCGIEEIFPDCKYQITNKTKIEDAKKLFTEKIRKNLIINIVGYSASGKSTVCKFVSDNLNIPLYEYGKKISKIVRGAGYQKSREYVKEKGINSYIELMDKEMIKDLNEFMKTNKIFIIDGIVSDEVYTKLKDRNEIYTIYIKLDKEERVTRLMKRESKTKEAAEKELEIKDSIKIESGLDIVTSRCNAIVDGSKKSDEVIIQVIELIKNYTRIS